MVTLIYTDETMDVSKGVRFCTQTEMERLHNIPEGYTKNLNKRQAGDLIGDGWTVDIIVHIFGYLKAEIKNVQPGDEVKCGVGENNV